MIYEMRFSYISYSKNMEANMKKILALVLALCMIFALAACGQSAATAATEAPAADAATEAPEAPEASAATEAPAAGGEYTLGMGVSLNTDSSKSGNAQVDATVAAVVLDAEGKIVSCRLDCAQSKMDISEGTVDTAAEFKTKMELGDDYGMVAYGNAIAEWDDQAKAIEEYVVGKTAEEVTAIETVQNDHGYSVAADETLYASCTMQITDFINAIVKACGDVNTMSFTSDGTFTLGLAAKTSAAESTDPTADADGVVKMYTEFGAAVVGADGKILAAVNDATQPNISFDEDGEITETSFKGTKMELGDDYGMVAYGNAIAEWDAQSQAFSQYVVGKTAAEVAAIETTKNDHGYSVAADETLLASCTIQITGMMAVIAQAAEYAR
jgi:predicted small lipoprotein YifL